MVGLPSRKNAVSVLVITNRYFIYLEEENVDMMSYSKEETMVGLPSRKNAVSVLVITNRYFIVP